MINCSGTRLKALLPMAKCLCAILNAFPTFLHNLFVCGFASRATPPPKHQKPLLDTCVWHFYLFGSCFSLSLFNLVCCEIDLLQSSQFTPVRFFFFFGLVYLYFRIFLTRPRLLESFSTSRRSRINAAVANVLRVTFT